MVRRYVFSRLAALALIIFGLSVSLTPAKAYGITNYSVVCPSVHVWGTTDDPLSGPSSMYVMYSVTDLRTGVNISHSPEVSPSTGIGEHGFDFTDNFTKYIPPVSVLTGDMLHIRMWDRHSTLLDVTVPCTNVSGRSVPVGFVLSYITCTTTVMSGNPGSVIGGITLVPGDLRYAATSPVLGRDSIWRIQVQASPTVLGFIEADCVA